jgi:hypothetical protein
MDDVTLDDRPEERRITLPDFVDLSQVTIPPIQPSFLIDRLLYKGDKLLVSGASKAGKSLLLLELAYAVATGTEWLGYQCTQGTVVYINFEIRANAFSDRYYRIRSAKGQAPDSGRLLSLNLRGVDCAEEGTGFVDALIEKLATLEPAPSLIIFDPFYKLGEGDENAVDGVHRVLRRIDEVANVTGASVAVVHHHPKGFQGSRSTIDRASGSGVFGRDFDCIVDLMQLDASKAIDDEIARREPEHFKTLSNHEQAQARHAFRQNAEAQWTPWRVETVTRHTAQPSPVDIWFEYPCHYVDRTGMLAAADYFTQKASNFTRRTEENMNQLHEAMEVLAAEGNTAPTYADIEAASGIKRNTAMRLVKVSSEYTVDKSEIPHKVVRKVVGND